VAGADRPGESDGTRVKRWLLLLGGAIALVAATKLLVENVLGIDLRPAVQRWIDDPGPGAAFAVLMLLVVDLVLPVPSSVVMVLSGAVFGVVKGAAIALAGSVGCSLAGFELARRYGRGAATRIAGAADVAHMERTFHRYGAGAVLVTRPLPIVKEAVSVVAGLSGMKRSTYVVATFAGAIPEAAIYAYAGAASRDAGSLVPALVILVGIAAAGWLVWRRRTE